AVSLGDFKGDEDRPDLFCPSTAAARFRSSEMEAEERHARRRCARVPGVERRALGRRRLAELEAAHLRTSREGSRPHALPSVRSSAFLRLLLIAEGRSVVEVAKQAGHSPTMTLATYGHVIKELDTTQPRSAEDLIREARSKSVRATFARAPR